MKIINNLLKTSLGLFIIFIIGISIATVIYKQRFSTSVIINMSKRIVAEGGAIVARYFWSNEQTNGFFFAPEVNPEISSSKREIIHYLENNSKDISVKIIKAKNYNISESAKNFQYENLSNSELQLLRKKYQIDELVSDADSEVERLIILRDWVRKTLPRGDPERLDYNFNALDILSHAEKGETFFCSGYSIVFLQCALSLGFTARYVGLFKGHVVSEIWSNELAKWVVMDAYNNLHYEKSGIPLNAIELHDMWEQKDFSNVEVVYGIQRTGFIENTKEDLLSYYHEFYVRMRNDWFSNRYPHWHPKANSIMNGLEWMDKFTSNNILVANETGNREDLYFPVNVTSINIISYDSNKERFHILFDTITPNFSHFLVNVNGKEFVHNKADFMWDMSKGKNLLEVSAVNLLGVKGSQSYIEIYKL